MEAIMSARGIEACFWGSIGRDPELKTSRNGNPYVSIGVAVVTGTTDDGKDITTWVQVSCFGETAEKIATRCKKGDRLYVEGTLSQTVWNDKHGETRHGLQVLAWKCERTGNIGKARERKSGAHQDNGQASTAKHQHADADEFGDEIGF
jgi:single-strand DNA-binding protein